MELNKYTKEDLERMGYEKVSENRRGVCYEHRIDHKRIVMKPTEDGKYEWWGVW